MTQEAFEVRTAIAPETLQSLVDSASPYVHVITIATKPDIMGSHRATFAVTLDHENSLLFEAGLQSGI